MPEPQIARVPVCLVVCVGDETARGHWYKMLDSSDFQLQAKNIPELQELQIEKVRSLDQARQRLDEIFTRSPQWGAALISDQLIGPDDDLGSGSDSSRSGPPSRKERGPRVSPEATAFTTGAAVAIASEPPAGGSGPIGGDRGSSPAATPPSPWQSPLRELRDHFANHTYVSVLLRDHPGRMADVDLVIDRYPKPQDWLSGLRLLVQRLHYFIPPGSLPPLQGAIRPRALQTFDEFCDALMLRRKVYEIMGYLEDRFLATESRMELCWHDAFSLHFGYFVPSRGRPDILAGTCRLILTKPPQGDVPEWCKRLRETKGRLDRLVKREQYLMAGFKLPIFHTMKLNDEMRKEAESDNPWAELSRVIVGPKWRGYGISSKLIQQALDEADRIKVECTLLECLEIHQKMYEKYGFHFLEQRGEVAGVGKTMIGMRRWRPK